MSSEDGDNVQKKIDNVLDESLSTTQRILGTAQETTEYGNRTIGNLEKQSEQLDRIERAQEDISSGIKRAEKNLNEFNRWCWCCMSVSDDLSDEPSSSSQATTTKTTAASESQPKSSDLSNESQRNSNRQQLMGDSGPTPAKNIVDDAREEEIQGNMDQILSYVGIMKNQANKTSEMLTVQDDQLQRLKASQEKNIIDLNKANERVQHTIQK